MIAALLLSLLSQAPGVPPAVVRVAGPGEVVIVAGQRAEVRLVFRIEDGYRIQANPAADRFLVPAVLELDEDPRVDAGSPKYPAGLPHRLRGPSTDLSIYEGMFEVRVTLQAYSPVAGSAEAFLLPGSLRYQACNEEVCLRPFSVDVQLPVRILPPAPPAGR